MSGVGVDWIAFFLFILLFVAAVAGEILWLSKKGWTTAGKAAGFVLLTDLISFGIGSFLVFALTLVAFMLVMGPQGRGSDTPSAVYVAIVVAGLIVPLLIFLLFKRTMLGVFGIRTGRSAWLYSVAASLFFLFAVIVPPPLVFYLVTSVWK